MSRLLYGFVWLATLVVAVVTVLPMFGSSEWWVRMWDFPRIHIIIVAMVTGGLALLALRKKAVGPVVILAAALAVQGAKIYPFTPFAKSEIEFTQPEGGPVVSALAVNVLQDNRDYAKVIGLIERQKPDVLLLMETDEGWNRALHDTLATYDTVLREPLSNFYGLIFATRLPVETAEVVYPVDDETPAALARLRDRAGRDFLFVGLHPRPPVPGTDTDARDAQIVKASDLVHDAGLPAVVMGDFNDVAWSWTAERYKHHGGFKDPRVGRGILPSFDANHPLLRFPIDQLYVTDGIELVSFDRGPHVGSDHFPITAEIMVAADVEPGPVEAIATGD